MIFKSRKDSLFLILIFGFSALFLVIIFFRIFSSEKIDYDFLWIDTLILFITFLLLWLNFDTKYELTHSELKYTSGPIRGKIKIEKIQEIIKGKNLWSGLKPATARNGLIIKYDQYNEIYISPDTNDIFIKKILEINKKIKVTT